jgi:hypothetical protein
MHMMPGPSSDGEFNSIHMSNVQRAFSSELKVVVHLPCLQALIVFAGAVKEISQGS